MSLYSLTKFAQIYSSHSCQIFRGVRKNLWNPSLEAPNNANAHEPSHCCGFVHIAQCSTMSPKLESQLSTTAIME
jgi:hypothetical protein